MPTHLCVLLLSLRLAARPLACSQGAGVTEQEPSCIVSHVVDGDTFRCRDGRKVRLTGIDSPEDQQGPFGAKARRALQGMLPLGTEVRLERDVGLTDRYRRRLAYAWSGSTLKRVMVRGGVGRALHRAAQRVKVRSKACRA